MSAADAGRRKIESRTAEYVSVGDRILDPNGREYKVVNLGEPEGENVTLNLQPIGQCGNRPFEFDRHTLIRVRRVSAPETSTTTEEA